MVGRYKDPNSCCQCGNGLDRKGSYCEKCCGIMRMRRKIKYEKLLLLGLCTQCQKPTEKPPLCDHHRIEASNRKRLKRKGRPRGGALSVRGDEYAARFKNGMKPYEIAKAYRVSASSVYYALKARGLWVVK